MKKSGFAPSVWGPTVWSIWIAVSTLPNDDASHRKLKMEFALLMTRLLPCEPCRVYTTLLVTSSGAFSTGMYNLEDLHRLRCRVRAKIDASDGDDGALLPPACVKSPSLQDCIRRIRTLPPPSIDPRIVLRMMAEQACVEDHDDVARGVVRILCLARLCSLLCALPDSCISLPRDALLAGAACIREFESKRARPASASDGDVWCSDACTAFCRALGFRDCADRSALDLSRGPAIGVARELVQ